jgi:oxalate decarboxylase/phosphoglucose isomerase-like protein (cupin superfamily)
MAPLSIFSFAAVVSLANAEQGGHFNTSTTYTAADIKYPWNLQVSTGFSCIWGAAMPGVDLYASVLTLPPCTWIAPHYHPGTTEINMVMSGKLDAAVFPYAEGVDPIHFQTQLGDLQNVPRSLIHLLRNDQCEDLSITHFFPSILDANFYSMWGTVQETSKSYQNAVLENGAEVFLSPEALKIPVISKGYNQPVQECMKRCGIDDSYYQKFTCPKKMPLLERGFESLANAKKGTPIETDKSGGLNTPWKKFVSDDFNFVTQLLKSTHYECIYGNDVVGEGLRHAVAMIAPCTSIAPHWHPTTNEVNVVLQGKLNYSMSQQWGRTPIHDQVGQAEQVLFPKGMPHMIANEQCHEVAFMHVLPSAMDEDFASLFGNLQKTSSQYKSDTFPQGKTDTLDNLHLSDGKYTVMPECMARCQLPADFHNTWACPARIPVKSGGIYKQIEVSLGAVTV